MAKKAGLTLIKKPLSFDEIDSLKATQILAFRSVQEQDHEYVYRYIQRWFSREFSTPLTEVEELPIDYVLQHFFECRYEKMDNEDLDEESLRLRETKVERLARERKDAEALAADEEFNKMAKEEARTNNLDKPINSNDGAIRAPTMGGSLPFDLPNVLPSNTLEKPVEIPPDIKMTFITPEEMEELGGWDLLKDPNEPPDED